MCFLHPHIPLKKNKQTTKNRNEPECWRSIHWNQDGTKDITEFSSDLKAAVHTPALEIEATAVKPITETYWKWSYAEYIITL